MLILRAILLELLVCFHVVGGAVVFRRLLPRESPWLAFVVPILAVMAFFNFVEHFIALPYLAWLMPFTLGGLLWVMVNPGYSWDGLRLPTTLFLVVFTWALFLKCMNPEITCNTEGVADMARVVDFTLGSTLPAVDSWCPPYDHGGYYSFQHYGASLVKRLFSLDIGTGYNMGYVLLNTLTCLVGAGAAYSVSGRRAWVAVLTLFILLANFTGSLLYLVYLHPYSPDTRLAIDIGDAYNDPARNNVFAWIYHVPPPVLRLFTPTFNLYFPEFHANLGGHFMTIFSLLAANEAFQKERSNWPWICLLIIPLLTIITATWFFIVVTVLCAGCFLACLLASRRPQSWTFVAYGTFGAATLLWPSVNSLISGSYPVNFHWTAWNEITPFWEFVIQWWPVIVPWIFLCFIWNKLSWLVRWIHFVVPVLLAFIEVATFQDRGLTVEKMWGAVYSTGLVTFLPIVFIQRSTAFRLLTAFYIVISIVFFASWVRISTQDVYWDTIAFHLKGDTVFLNDPQKKRLLQVLKRMHNQTVLNGKSAWSYNQSPSIVGFSENKCYIAWFMQEYQCGHGGEAEFRDQQSMAFFAGTMPHPLEFLRSNDIAAVMIWPEDEIPDALLEQFKNQLRSDYYYIDCHDGGPNNAGVFIRNPQVGSFQEKTPVTIPFVQ